MRKLNWLREPEDGRDYRIGCMFAAPYSVPVPERADLSALCSAVEDQGAVGSCTGNALAGAMEFVARRDGRAREFSRLFAYYNARAFWAKRADTGAFIRDVIKAAARYGVCEEKVWPYVERDFAKTPSLRAYTDARLNQVTRYAKLTEREGYETLRNVRVTLARGLPVVFGFDVYEHVTGEACAMTGVVKIPEKGERVQGGHAVLAVGYDDGCKALLCRNSWGAAWGIKGYFWLPYWYVTEGAADDFWTVEAQERGRVGMGDRVKGCVNWMQARGAGGAE